MVYMIYSDLVSIKVFREMSRLNIELNQCMDACIVLLGHYLILGAQVAS